MKQRQKQLFSNQIYYANAILTPHLRNLSSKDEKKIAIATVQNIHSRLGNLKSIDVEGTY